VLVIKKYGNRRLYDTVESKYIKLEEVADRIRKGADVRVLDAKTEKDLTQATLAQIILESRGAAKMLPEHLLTQLIRMGDDDLTEFFGRFVGVALEMYGQARQGAQGLLSYNPFMSNPMGFMGRLFQRERESPPPERTDVADLRKEVEALKRTLKRRR
jgi:polyhydroxyalkanoate synthesis repressor PhaR